MIVNNIRKSTIVSHGTGNETAIGVNLDNLGMLQHIFRDMIYKFPLKAAIWEPLCNAVDEQVKYNSHKSLVLLTSDDQIVIRDYARGLCDSDVINVFFRYLTSTKALDNLLTGGFGIGACAPGAYAESWSVTSTFGGYRTTFLCKIVNDTSVVDVVDKVPWEGNTGIEVLIPLKEKQRKADRSEAKQLLNDFARITDKPDILEVDASYKELSDHTDCLCVEKIDKLLLGANPKWHVRRANDGMLKTLYQLLDSDAFMKLSNDTTFISLKDEMLVESHAYGTYDYSLRFEHRVFRNGAGDSYVLLYDGDSLFNCKVNEDKFKKAAPHLYSISNSLNRRTIFKYKRGELTVLPDRDNIRDDDRFYAFIKRKDKTVASRLHTAIDEHVAAKLSGDNPVEFLDVLAAYTEQYNNSGEYDVINMLSESMRKLCGDSKLILKWHELRTDGFPFYDSEVYLSRYVLTESRSGGEFPSVAAPRSCRAYNNPLSGHQVYSRKFVFIEKVGDLASCSVRALQYAAWWAMRQEDIVLYITSMPVKELFEKAGLPDWAAKGVLANNVLDAKTLDHGLKAYKSYLEDHKDRDVARRVVRPVLALISKARVVHDVNLPTEHECNGMVIMDKADRDNNADTRLLDHNGRPTYFGRALSKDVYGKERFKYCVSVAGNEPRKRLMAKGAVMFHSDDITKAVNIAVERGALALSLVQDCPSRYNRMLRSLYTRSTLDSTMYKDSGGDTSLEGLFGPDLAFAPLRKLEYRDVSKLKHLFKGVDNISSWSHYWVSEFLQAAIDESEIIVNEPWFLKGMESVMALRGFLSITAHPTTELATNLWRNNCTKVSELETECTYSPTVVFQAEFIVNAYRKLLQMHKRIGTRILKAVGKCKPYNEWRKEHND